MSVALWHDWRVGIARTSVRLVEVDVVGSCIYEPRMLAEFIGGRIVAHLTLYHGGTCSPFFSDRRRSLLLR
jgi:hypothetical protein